MASVNKAILVGHLGRDPETRYLPDGTPVVNASLATSYRWKDRESGETKEETEWHRLVLRGRLAEIAGEYLKKGSAAYVEGRIRTRKWQDKEGQDRYTTEIVVSALQMLGARAGDSRAEPEPPAPKRGEPAAKAATRAEASAPAAATADETDDIPF